MLIILISNFGSTPQRNTWGGTLTLAYQSFGIVYGDLSITPLYVFKSSLSGIAEVSDSDTEILGVLSLIFWTLTLISLAKYMLIVLKANDDGEGLY
jgi:KUP system potassium uptake protein